MKVVVTGAAGFIGTQIGRIVLAYCDQLVGRDDLLDHFVRQIKPDRASHLVDKVDPDLDVLDFVGSYGAHDPVASGNLGSIVLLAASGAVRQPYEALRKGQNYRLASSWWTRKKLAARLSGGWAECIVAMCPATQVDAQESAGQ